MITRSTFNKEYVPGYFALMIDSYINKRTESKWPMLCAIKSSKKAKEQRIRRSGLSLPQVKAEGAGVTYDNQIAGPEQTWVHNVYALACRITEEAIDDNLYELGAGGDTRGEIFTDLGWVMEYNIESKMARFLNSGTASTYHTTDKSQVLFYASHTRLDGGTYSNISSSADLTYLNFWTAVIAAENQYNEKGLLVRRKVKKLWVPPQLERAAREILQSPERPDVGDRAMNAIIKSNRNISIEVWDQITDTDMWALQLEGDGIIFFWRRKTRFARERDFQTGDMQVKADQRWSAEVNDPRAWYGNVP